jgi:hypothetical protein
MEALHGPFSVEELCNRAARVKSGKSVLGALKPTLLKRSKEDMAAPLAALLNACVRVGSMPHVWAVSFMPHFSFMPHVWAVSFMLMTRPSSRLAREAYSGSSGISSRTVPPGV